MTGNRIIKIFLASSSELKGDREQFEIFINRKNKEYIRKSIFLELVIWEDFIDAMSATRLQNEYNNAIGNCDVFVSLFYTKVGQYTEEEFSKALETFQLNQKPLVYTYFKSSPIDISSITIEINSLLKFKKKLNELGHFYKPYKNIDDFKYLFDQQLNKFIPKLIENIKADYQSEKQESEQFFQSRISQLEEELKKERSHKQQLGEIEITAKDKVVLKSAKGVDYTKLQKLLKLERWQEADKETANVMLKVASREDEKWLRGSDIENFPCEDLRTINQLWLNYSGGKFGFSVQKEIYESLGGTREYNEQIWTEFGDRLGWWKKGENWLNYDKLTFNLDEAPTAHLPFTLGLIFWGVRWNTIEKCYSSLAQRLVTCKT